MSFDFSGTFEMILTLSHISASYFSETKIDGICKVSALLLQFFFQTNTYNNTNMDF